MSQGYSVKEFQSVLKEQVEKICKEENLNFDNEARGTLYWIAKLYKENNSILKQIPMLTQGESKI